RPTGSPLRRCDRRRATWCSRPSTWRWRRCHWGVSWPRHRRRRPPRRRYQSTAPDGASGLRAGLAPVRADRWQWLTLVLPFEVSLVGVTMRRGGREVIRHPTDRRSWRGGLVAGLVVLRV